ncbi:hypothetical protein [Pelagibacterium luteolum]|uniref:Uncharacterized protein n=1 Tax=Pelagibacterium luteolum TaxID=440168 RepID=A0A1G7XV44_9HYPH|nr:hypothetical protein [Pelagibacterium luteolum]SDG88072.1 hypothetical protein SAMN04487974_11119 [Pelagibacterium luteolum]
MSHLFSTRGSDTPRSLDLEDLARRTVTEITFDLNRRDDVLGLWAPLDGVMRAVTSYDGGALENAARTILSANENFVVFNAGLQMGITGSGAVRSERYRPDLVAINKSTGVLVISEFKRRGGNHPTNRLNGLGTKLERAAANARTVLASHAQSFEVIKLAIVDIDGDDVRPLTVNLEQFEEILGAPGFAKSMARFRLAFGQYSRPIIAQLAKQLVETEFATEVRTDRRAIEPASLNQGPKIEFCRAPRKTSGGL